MNEIMMLGLGLEAPWKLVGQYLDMEKSPHEFRSKLQPIEAVVTHALLPEFLSCM
jgi:hypothetical protein